MVRTSKFKLNISKINKIIKKCNLCKNEFLSWKSQNQKFCSSKCYWTYKKGTTIIQNISDVEKHNRRKRMIGERNPMWKGGDSDKDRRNSVYKNWRISVFKRDNFICQKCGYYNGSGIKRRDLNAHHIVSWIESIELRYEISNGKTLCVPCHIKEHQNKN